jgi:outer membrane protein TolC
VLDSWEEALARLRARSVDLQLVRADLLRAEAQARLALAPLLPSLSGSLSLQEDLAGGGVLTGGGGGGIPVGGDDDGPSPTSPLVSARADLRQSVFDATLWQQLSSARALEESARLAVADGWRVLVRGLARSLVAVVAAERTAEVDRVGLAQAEERLRLTQEAERLGTGRKLDVLRTSRDVEVARADALASGESLRRVREALGLALGARGEVGVRPGFTLGGLVQGVRQQCEPLWGGTRADVLAARKAVEAARRELDGARLSYAPSLGLQSSFVALTVDPGFARVRTWNVAAVLEVPLFDGNARAATVRAQEAALQQAEGQLEQVERTVSVEVLQARRAVALAEAFREAALRGREAAAQTDTLTREAFRQGVGTSLELVQSALELRQAERTLALRELDLVQARVDTLLAEASCTP